MSDDNNTIPEINLKTETKEIKSGIVYTPYVIFTSPYIIISDKNGTRKVWNSSKKKIILYYLYKFTRIKWFINKYNEQSR
jgi:hypothetical protein